MACDTQPVRLTSSVWELEDMLLIVSESWPFYLSAFRVNSVKSQNTDSPQQSIHLLLLHSPLCHLLEANVAHQSTGSVTLSALSYVHSSVWRTSGGLCLYSITSVVLSPLSFCSLLPETPGARAHVRRSPATVVVRDALRAAKVLGQEVQLVHGWLEGQLVQAFLGGAWRLQRHSETEDTRLNGEQPSVKTVGFRQIDKWTSAPTG